MSKLAERLREQGCSQVGEDAANALDACERALRQIATTYQADGNRLIHNERQIKAFADEALAKLEAAQ